MSRGYPEIRLSEQIRTLFHAGSLGALPDGQLLERYASRDGEVSEMAFAALVERHGPMVLGVCRRLLSDSHLAEDAFQATFLVLARRAKSVRNRYSLGGWLHRVAHRIASRLSGPIERRKSRERPGAEEVAVEHPDHVERDELRTVIDQEIDRLVDAQRLPVVLCCLEGISHEEASQRLHWPLGTTKSRLARGRRKLQERLLRRGVGPSAAFAAAGTGLLGMEVSAAVPPALIEATAKAAAAVAAGGAFTGVVPATLSVLVRAELSAMIATKLKLAVAATLTAVGSAALIGYAIGAAPGLRSEVRPVVAAIARNVDEPKGQAEAPRLAAKLSASGTVVDSNGKPVARARVILREWSEFRIRGMTRQQTEKIVKGEEINDTLMETKTDEAGRFQFQDVPAPAVPDVAEAGRSVYPWDIVALAQGQGLAWVQLTPQHQRNPITLKLGPEGILRGRVVEPGGKPVLGAKVKVVGVGPLGRLDVYGNRPDNELNLSWSTFPLRAIADRDGRFTVRGLPREKMVTLTVNEPRHEMVYSLAATTDLPQPDVVLSTNPKETRMPIHTGEFTLTAKVADHVLTGRVIREADGKPAARAQLIHNGIAIQADENGRYRIEGLVAGKLELHASPDSSDTDAAPVVAQIEIPETPTEIEHNVTLPRGLVVTGRVVDGTTGAGIEKALVDFSPKPEPGQTPTLFGFSKETGRDGRFQLVVPPGRGTIVLRTFPAAFPKPERQFTGQPEDPKFSREVEGRGGQTIEVADFYLARGRVVVVRVVDPDGLPLANARIDIRDPNRPFNAPPGRSDTAGRHTVVGLAPDHSTALGPSPGRGW